MVLEFHALGFIFLFLLFICLHSIFVLIHCSVIFPFFFKHSCYHWFKLQNLWFIPFVGLHWSISKLRESRSLTTACLVSLIDFVHNILWCCNYILVKWQLCQLIHWNGGWITWPRRNIVSSELCSLYLVGWLLCCLWLEINFCNMSAVLVL